MLAVTLDTSYLWSGIVLAVCASLPFVWKGIKLIAEFFRMLSRAAHTANAELNNNGGGSVKDSIAKLVAGQDEMRMWMAKHDGLHQGAWGD